MASSKNKTVPTNKSVLEFINEIEDPDKRKFAAKIHQMMEQISGEDAVMWGTSIIGYGNYHYKYASGREGDFMKVGFSPANKI